MFDWKKDLISKLPKGKGSVKKFGRSNEDKFNTIMKSIGQNSNAGWAKTADNANRAGSFNAPRRMKKITDGSTLEEWDKKFGLGEDWTKKQEDYRNTKLQQEKAKKQSTQERDGFLGFLDKTLGRIGNTANEMAFGKGFNDAQNENYKKIAESNFKKNPLDNIAKQNLQMANTINRPAHGKLEKVSDFIGNTAGIMAPYTIGGAYGAAEKGLQALSKIKPVAKYIEKPLAKDLVRGLQAGVIAGSERAAMHKGASNENVSAKDIALESALAGGGDAALGAVVRNLNLKGQLDTLLHDTKSKKYNSEEFKQALHEVFGKKGDVSNVVADVPKTMPKPFELKYQNLKLPPKTMNSFKTNDIPSVEIPDVLKETAPKPKTWLNFAQSSKYEPKARMDLSPAERSHDPLNRGQDYWQKRYEGFAEELKNNGYSPNNLSKEALDELWTHFAKRDEPVSLSQVVDLAYGKGPQTKIKTFNDFNPEQRLKDLFTPKPTIKDTLKADPRIAEAVNKLNSLGPKVPPKANVEDALNILNDVGTKKVNPIPNKKTFDDAISELNQKYKGKGEGSKEAYLQDLTKIYEKYAPNVANLGENVQIPASKNQLPTAKLQEFINTVKKVEPIKPQALKPGKDFLPIEQQKFGTKLARAETAPENKFNFPYKHGDPLPDTRSHIGTKTEKKLPSMAEVANKGYIKAVDNLHRLSQFDNQVKNVLGRDLKPTESTHMLGLNSRGSDMISKQILTQNMVNKNGDAIGKSLKDITMQVPKGKLKDFEDYLINKHAITRMDRGEKVFPDEMQMSPAKSEAKVKQYEADHPEFKQIAKEYYDYNKQLGQHWLVDTGILSKDQWEGYLKANPHYVPNNRVFSSLEQPKFTNSAKKGFANQSNPVKKAIGSQRKIVSPIESTIEHTAQYVKTAKRNEVMQTLINNIKQNPEAFKDWAEIVPTDKTPSSIMETLQKEGVDGVLENLNKGFDQKPDLSKGNIIRGLIDGKPVHVKVHDPHLLDALTNLSPKAQNIVIHSLGQVTRVMKNLTTGINPVFSLTRNIFRDIPTAYTNSKTTNNPFVFSKDLVQSVVSVFKNDELYRSFKAVGGGHASPVSSDVNLLAQSKRSILPQKGLRPLLGKGLGALENLNNAVEAAPRLAEFKRIAGNSYDSKMKALYEANDVTVNFNKYGNVAKEIDSVVPYFNAAVQGLDKQGRVFFSKTATPKQKMTAALKAFTGITIPTVVLYSINHDNPDYQKVSNYIKDSNFLIPKGDGTFYKIPKPRELGVLFGSDVERTLNMWLNQDPKAFQDFTTTILDNFIPPKRTVLDPFNDLRANKNFMNAPIIPGDLQNVSPQYQYDSKTSEVSKKIGDLTGLSPMKLDYIAKSYGGIIGELGIPATTKDTTIGQTLKQKVTVDPVFSNDLQRRFYDMKTKLDQAHNDLTKQGVKNPNLNEPLRKLFNKTSLEMGKIRKEIKATQNDDNLTPQQRLDKIRKLQEFINQMALQANKSVR